MADLSKLKRRNTLGAPPPLEEASQNLQAPELAPELAPEGESPPVVRRRAAGTARHVASPQEDTSPRSPRQRRLDGRSMRKTGRTVQFATRVSEEWDEKLRHIAQRDGLLLVEVLERALDAYEEARK
jgi:hypothetical protein